MVRTLLSDEVWNKVQAIADKGYDADHFVQRIRVISRYGERHG